VDNAIFLFAMNIIEIFAIQSNCATNTLGKMIVPHRKRRSGNLEVEGIAFVQDKSHVLVRCWAFGRNRNIGARDIDSRDK
jgi:hypothetical protein